MSPDPAPSTPPERRKSRRSHWLTFGIPLMLVGGVLALVIAHDDPAPADSDMEPTWAQQESRSNPLGQFCVDIVNAAPTSVAPVPDHTDLDPQIAIYKEDVAEWPSVLHLMATLAASDAKTWRWPDADLMRTTDEPYYIEDIQKRAYVLEAKAKLLSHQGRTKEAIDTTFQLILIGQGMLNTPGDFAHQRLGMSLVSRGLALLEWVITTSAASPELLRHCMTQLEPLHGPSLGNLEFAIKVEYQRLKQLIRQKEWLAAMGDPWSDKMSDKLLGFLAFKPNRTLSYVLSMDRAILRRLSHSHLEGYIQSLSETSQLETSTRKRGVVKLVLGANLGGLEGIHHSVSAIENHLRWAIAHDNELDQARIVLAMRLHELEKGSLPASLQELVPAHLPTLPIDTFSGEPMRWNASTKVVYSIGPNFKDDHGHIRTTGPALHKDDSMPYWWRQPASKSKGSAP